MTKRLTRLDCYRPLLVGPINHALTNFADHAEDISHDVINRFLCDEKMTPRLVWENVREQIAVHEDGCIAFDELTPYK